MTINDMIFAYCVENDLFDVTRRDRFDNFVGALIVWGASIRDIAVSIRNHGNVTLMSLDDIENDLAAIVPAAEEVDENADT